MEYHKKASSGVSKAALATAIGAGVVALGGGNGLGGILGGGILPARAAAPYAAPVAYAPPVAFAGVPGCDCYVTEKEMCLIRENSAQGSVIAQLSAEKYADAAVKAATDPLTARVCALETAEAVNGARDRDFRRYVEREFVHQPKASIRESIVVCRQCGCERDRCDCDHFDRDR